MIIIYYNKGILRVRAFIFFRLIKLVIYLIFYNIIRLITFLAYINIIKVISTSSLLLFTLLLLKEFKYFIFIITSFISLEAT